MHLPFHQNFSQITGQINILEKGLTFSTANQDIASLNGQYVGQAVQLQINNLEELNLVVA